MIKKIASKETLMRQAEALKKKKVKPGFDGMSAEGAASWMQINGARLSREIMDGAYRPMPAMGFRTAKQDGKYRTLAKLTVLDTAVQSAILEVLTPICEEHFHDSSFAYRPSRGVSVALERYVYLAGKHKYVAKLDFSACFDNIDHGIMETALERFVPDARVRDLIMEFVRMPLAVDDEIRSRDKGLVQGMPLAPLLCNIYLHAVDLYLEEQGIEFLRYADDTVIFGDSPSEIEAQYRVTAAYYEEHLNLQCNHRKCKLGTPTQIRFLGHRFEVDRRGLVALADAEDGRNIYRTWHSEHLRNLRGRVDILSDGILRQKDYALLFDSDLADEQIPPMTTEIINIYSSVIFDSGFLETAMKHGIAVNVFDAKGGVIGRFYPETELKAPMTTHRQLDEYYDEARRILLGKEFLLASIHNSVLNIRYYRKHEQLKVYDEVLALLKKVRSLVREECSCEQLLLLEARARKAYYDCYDHFIHQETFSFDSRTRRPPQNEVNAMISFGNTVLYSMIASEIQRTALDVRVGFLHATNTRKESLNLDVAEIFKPLVVDRTVFTLINRRVMEKEHFVRLDNGAVYLNAEGKRVFLRAFYEKLDTVVTVKEEKMNYNRIIKEEIRKLIRHFRHGDPYEAFRQVR